MSVPSQRTPAVRYRTGQGDGVDSNGPGDDGAVIEVLLAIFDFPMLVEGFRAVIDREPDMRIAGHATGLGQLSAALAATPADVVIAECLPFGAPGSGTFAAIERIREAAPELRILVVECRGGTEQFGLALKAGADGFLNREADPSDIVAAVRSVVRGQTYVAPAIVTRMVNRYVLRNGDGPLEDAYAGLTEREREVLLLAAVGHTNREIAKIFHLSEQTVHNYRASIMEKLGFHDRMELLKFAIRRGIVSVADL
jgi:two-component system response regulator NreC